MFRKPALKHERRRHERRAFPSYMQFKNDATGELIGDLADISRSGFRLECSRPTPPNSELRFRVDMPPEIQGRASIVFTAQTRWLRPHPVDPRLHISGYLIRSIDPVDSRSLEQIFAQCHAASSIKKNAHDYVWQD